MLTVHLTVDTEIWPTTWETRHQDLPRYFRQYVYGPGPAGDHALPGTVRRLNEHGLVASFFVESLFAREVGLTPLEEIVGIVREGRQDVQLHVHAEWEKHSSRPTLAPREGFLLRDYTEEEQAWLIARGLETLRKCGVREICAFRAGNYALDRNTLRALASNGIHIDTSFNAAVQGRSSGLDQNARLFQPAGFGEVLEVPVTVFADRPGHYRHAQLAACSFGELEAMLWQALEKGWDRFVIVSHNFEMLNPGMSAADPVVVRRFERLCHLLDGNRDCFRTCGFSQDPPRAWTEQPAELTSNLARTGLRFVEQFSRRLRA